MLQPTVSETRHVGTGARDDFEIIASAFVEEDRFEWDQSWQTLIECLTLDPPGQDIPEHLVAFS